MRPGTQSNPQAFKGPMAVIVNEWSRSGKEALAFQFKKGQRATVVGMPTSGYFSGGSFFLMDKPSDYMLFLCVNLGRLDGTKIEGIGVKPNVQVEFSANNEFQDSQLKAALEALK